MLARSDREVGEKNVEREIGQAGVELSQHSVARILLTVNRNMQVLVLLLVRECGQGNKRVDWQDTEGIGELLRKGLLEELEGAVPG